MRLSIRQAVIADIPRIEALIDASVRGLQAQDYTPEQIDAALRTVFTVDSRLIADGTYYVAELEGTSELAGCGGWSKRKTLFGGDRFSSREDDLLDPAHDAARIRAFFVHPAHARRGIAGAILEACENAAIAAGFTRFKLGATLTGVPFYLAKGYTALDRVEAALDGAPPLTVIRMEKGAGADTIVRMLDAPNPEIPIERFEIFANGLDHPECLAFDRNGWLWAGGEAGQVYRISPAGDLETVAEMGGFCAGVAWPPDDAELFVCNPKHGVVRVKRNGEWSVFAASAGGRQLICPNYGVFDRRGNYYMTDSGNWRKHNGCLIRYTPEGKGEVIAGPLGYANGLALSTDERHLFMVESDTDSVYRIDLETGASSLYAERVGRLPDGLALDAEGELFASCYASDDIYRIDSAGKVQLYAYDRWAILLSRPTNIAFRDGYLYAANLGRTTITRAHVGRAGKPLANEQ